MSRGTSRPRSARRAPGAGWRGAAIGVDLGGTKVALGIVNASGRVLDSARLPTRRGAPQVIDDIARTIVGRWGKALPSGAPIGVGVAAQVAKDGTVIFGPNLRWHDVPLGSLLARALHRRVTVLNDVQAATYGEWRYGAGRGSDDLVCLFVGTGVGGGVVLDGALRRGATLTAGELGHLTVEQGGRRCRCPNSGCLEAYAGGWAIAQRAREAATADPSGARRLIALAGTIDTITSETVERAYRAGDALAREIMRETTGYLAAGLVSIVNALDPSTIVLGGGVLAGYPDLLPRLARQIRSHALTAAVEGLRLVPAALGAESGVVGSAAFALDSAG